MFAFDKSYILDGATGKNLIKAGMPPGACPEAWTLSNPGALGALQRGYVAAGSGILLAPTFGANRVKLGKYGLAGRLSEMNRALVALSRENAGGRALVAGDMTTLGEFPAPFGTMEFEDFVSVYREQAEALESAGVDLFFLETMMTLCEARAALLAVGEVSSKPVVCCFTFEPSGRTLNGGDPGALAAVLGAMGAVAFGANCSVGPDIVLRALERAAPYTSVPLIAKPNAGLPAQDANGEDVYPLSPSDMAGYASAFAALGARLFGGCCGTTPEHIEALSAAVSALSLPRFPAAPVPAAAGERAVFPLAEIADIPPAKDYDEDLLDEGEGVLHLRINSEGDAASLGENQHRASCALCLTAEREDLLEAALRVYNGRALVSGGFCKSFEKYGAVRV